MGSYCELRFDSISVLSYKSSVPDDFIYLFQESDRRLVPRASEEDEEPKFDIKYSAPRAIVLRRLDLAGYTEGRTRKAFDDWRESELETWSDYLTERDWAIRTVNALKSFTYDEWQKRLRGVLHTRYSKNECADEIDREMRANDEAWLFFGSDHLMAIRAMLCTLPEINEVILDISDLVNGGYIGENERICDQARAPDARERSILEPTVIITEGSTDILVLRRSLD